MTWLLAGLSGLLLTLIFPKFDLTLLVAFALVPLLVAIAREPNWRRRLLLGELCGFVFWMGVCYWIRPVLAAYGGLTPSLAWLTVVLFALVKGLHTAVFAAAAGCVIHRAWAIPAIGALWVGIERTHSTFGFAWLALGNAGADMDFAARVAPFTGVYGLSFIFVAMNMAVALILLRRPRLHLVWLLPLLGLFLFPALPESPGKSDEAAGSRSIVALQSNLKENEKPSLLGMGVRSAAASIAGPEMIVWPEVPTGFYWDRDSDFQQAMDRLARWTSKPVLFGGVTFDNQGRPYNSAILIGSDGKELGRYSKMNLVPFGEFIPPLFGWIEKISTEAGDFAPGEQLKVLPVNDLKLGTFICYESAFPHFVRRFAREGANVLINISNDGWFFDTAAREQHLLLARMRAIENRRWLVRVTNNGITASIDPSGRVRQQQPEFRATAARLRFDPIAETTVYSRVGDWFAWSCLALAIALVIRAELPARRHL